MINNNSKKKNRKLQLISPFAGKSYYTYFEKEIGGTVYIFNKNGTAFDLFIITKNGEKKLGMKNILVKNTSHNKYLFFSPMTFKTQKDEILKRFIITGMKFSKDYKSLDVDSRKYGGPYFEYDMEFEINKNISNEYSKDEKECVLSCIKHKHLLWCPEGFPTIYRLE